MGICAFWNCFESLLVFLISFSKIQKINIELWVNSTEVSFTLLMQILFLDFSNYVKHFLEIVHICLDHFIQQSSDKLQKMRCGGGGKTVFFFFSSYMFFTFLYLKKFFSMTSVTRTCFFPSLSPFGQICPELKHACAE